jgi:hypothetical protein
VWSRQAFVMGLAIVFCVVVLYAMASVGDKTTLRIGAFLPLTESKESPLNVIWSVPRAGDICQLAVEHVNNFSELLPNYTLQLVTNDTKVNASSFVTKQVISCRNCLTSLWSSNAVDYKEINQ